MTSFHSICSWLHSICSWLHSICSWLHSICSWLHSICSWLHSICSWLHSICSWLHSICSWLHSICSWLHSICSWLHSICSWLHSICSWLHSICSWLHSICSSSEKYNFQNINGVRIMSCSHRIKSLWPEANWLYYSQNFSYISKSTEGQSWSEFLNLKDIESVFFLNLVSQTRLSIRFLKSKICN